VVTETCYGQQGGELEGAKGDGRHYYQFVEQMGTRKSPGGSPSLGTWRNGEKRLACITYQAGGVPRAGIRGPG
jgi:hypothetical protein